ncbi:MAG: mechanosensitive ion channel family protein [Phycisphaerales bacterium JB060]
MYWQDEEADLGAQGAEGAETTDFEQAATGLWEKVGDGQFNQITMLEVWTILQPIVIAIVLIVIVLLVAKWAKSLTVKAVTKARVEITLAKFFGNLVKWAILLMGAVTILQTFGVEATSFAAVLAAMGFAIGLALSGTLGNVAAGVMLLVFRPYRVGDVVNVNGVTAKVDEIELFTTILDTFDNRRIIMPNSEIFGNTIENISHHKTRRVDVAVGTAYDADIDTARETLMAAAMAVEGRLEDPAPVVYLNELGDSSISWAVRVWVNAADFWPVKDRLTRDVKYALDKAGIGIPFPQRELNLSGPIEVRLAEGSSR